MVELPRCGRCGIAKPASEFYPDKTKARGHHSICRECVKQDRRDRYREDPAKYRAKNVAWYAANRDRQLEYNRDLRRRALAAYGDRCACCGEATPEFLGIDHVNNDGEAHRRELKGYGRAIYQWLKNRGYPQDGRFQILCHNCNVAKGCYGGCPHQGPVPGRRRKAA